jgi:cobalt/nickel transport protein|uniref:Cobalt transport protein CbiN n=1 Tax=Desulfobacca acetoxidans TaxID=60893 RepID=A0A7C3Z0P9_9BACT
MKRYQNILLLAAVALLIILPLVIVEKPEPQPGQKEVEIFTGADGQAKNLVSKLQPDYKPWFEPLLQPPSDEVASLLFALQAALGAGFIGYWLGSSVTKAKFKKIS